MDKTVTKELIELRADISGLDRNGSSDPLKVKSGVLSYLITRVPGGWLYTKIFRDLSSIKDLTYTTDPGWDLSRFPEEASGTSTFVPYDNGSIMKEKSA